MLLYKATSIIRQLVLHSIYIRGVKMKLKESESKEIKIEAKEVKEEKLKQINHEQIKQKEVNLMNVLLCFGVVMVHLTASPVTSLQKDSIWYLLLYILNKSLCFVVPAFLFLSGFKLYNKYKDEKIDVKKFYMR